MRSYNERAMLTLGKVRWNENVSGEIKTTKLNQEEI